MVRISIIVPVYNAEKYIERCLFSIFNQSYKNIEIIIVNDGSTDQTRRICESIISKNTKYKIILINNENQGSAVARNIGLENATGEFISFIDADDYVDCDFLKILYDYQKKYDADIVQCGFDIGTEMKKRKPTYSSNQCFFKHKQDMFIDFCDRKTYMKTVVLWNKLYKRELFENLKIRQGKSIDDEYIILELIKRSNLIVDITNKLYTYYLSPNSQMRSIFTMKKLEDQMELIEYQKPIVFSVIPEEYYGVYLYRVCRGLFDYKYYIKKKKIDDVDLIEALDNYIEEFFGMVIACPNVGFKEKVFLLLQCICPAITWKWKRGKI